MLVYITLLVDFNDSICIVVPTLRCDIVLFSAARYAYSGVWRVVENIAGGCWRSGRLTIDVC